MIAMVYVALLRNSRSYKRIEQFLIKIDSLVNISTYLTEESADADAKYRSVLDQSRS